MAPDDSEVDSGADADEVTETSTDLAATSGPGSVAARLSTAMPSRRAYGVERTADSVEAALLTPQERQYLQHAHRLDDADRDAVEAVVSERVDEFVATDWPVIRERCPDVADALREELCEPTE